MTISLKLCGAKGSCLYRWEGIEYRAIQEYHHPRNQAKRYRAVV